MSAAVNLKLLLDGSDDFWVMPVTVGDTPHSYHWMPYRVGQVAKAEELDDRLRGPTGASDRVVLLRKEGRK